MIHKKKKVLVVARDINHGQVFTRIHTTFKQLKHKYDIRCVDLFDVKYADLHYTDIVVIPHPVSHDELFLITKAKAHFGVKCVVDIDDLLTELPTDHPFFDNFKTNHAMEIIAAADMCVYSTKHLFDTYAYMNRQRAIIPNAIDPMRYPQARLPRPHKNAFIVGWTGSDFHKADQYETFLPDLKAFLNHYPDAKAFFHGTCPDPLFRQFGTQIIFESRVVSHMDYAIFTQSYPFDVCLVGLDNNNFNDAKSDLRFIEMAALRIPCIASPRADFVKHKEKSLMLYAENSSKEHPSWYEQMQWAKANAEKLTEMGEAAFDYVMSERTTKQTAKQWEEVLENL
jgi:glycosyltransferase involved in cell wall biosynthesis